MPAFLATCEHGADCSLAHAAQWCIVARMSCDILVLAPHPDDAEIHCGGTIARHVRLGARVVLADATGGEMGSRGDAATRAAEASAAAQVLGVQARECLGLPDGGVFANDSAAREAVVDCIRRNRPALILALSGQARHPDHQGFAGVIAGALKAAALHRYATPSGAPAFTVRDLLWYEAELPLLPDLIVPLSEEDWARKEAAVDCYGSQFFKPGKEGPETSISRPAFRTWIQARGRTWGHQVGAEFGEAFVRHEALAVGNLLHLTSTPRL